jgi:cytochrome c
MGLLLAVGAVSAANAQDAAAKGAQAFQVCSACHSIEKDGEVMIGPNLWGVYGAKAAGKEDFGYSAALKASGLVWTEDNLDKWLTSPSKFVPGSIMAYPGMADPEQRKAVIAFLKAHAG